jgi:hypothetical protein
MSGVVAHAPVDAPPAPAPGPSPRPRRVAAPSWLDLRLALGVLLVLASVLIGAKVVAGARHQYPRVAVRHDLAAGVVLSASDLRLVRVQLPGRGTHTYLTQLREAIGQRLTRPVSAGELLPRAALGPAPVRTTVTVPLPAGSAPELRKGQRIEVWLSTPACASVVLLPDVPVQAVHAEGGGAFGAGSDGQDVVISVPASLAERVVRALALSDAHLRAGVLSGTSPPGDAPVLPDLGSCAGDGK